VSATLVPGVADDPRVRVRIQTVPKRPFRYLFGCVATDGRLRDVPVWVEVAIRTPVAGAEVEIPVAPEVPVAFRRMWATGCAGLALLDANPIIDGARPLPAIAEARLATDLRKINFR
jgi:hypothetical protein